MKYTQRSIIYIAFGIEFLWLLLLGWVSGAVGIIWSENNPANLMYRSIPALLLVGSIISRLRPQGMKWTLLLTSFVQILIPLIALFVWPAKASRWDAGVIGVFIVNSLFVVPFIVSALLFGKVSKNSVKQEKT